MALAKGIRIHVYLDDWLIRAQSQEQCLQFTREVVFLVESLGWLINEKKSELQPMPIFDFVSYRYNLLEALVHPTPDR